MNCLHCVQKDILKLLSEKEEDELAKTYIYWCQQCGTIFHKFADVIYGKKIPRRSE